MDNWTQMSACGCSRKGSAVSLGARHHQHHHHSSGLRPLQPVDIDTGDSSSLSLASLHIKAIPAPVVIPSATSDVSHNGYSEQRALSDCLPEERAEHQTAGDDAEDAPVFVKSGSDCAALSASMLQSQGVFTTYGSPEESRKGLPARQIHAASRNGLDHLTPHAYAMSRTSTATAHRPGHQSSSTANNVSDYIHQGNGMQRSVSDIVTHGHFVSRRPVPGTRSKTEMLQQRSGRERCRSGVTPSGGFQSRKEMSAIRARRGKSAGDTVYCGRPCDACDLQHRSKDKQLNEYNSGDDGKRLFIMDSRGWRKVTESASQPEMPVTTVSVPGKGLPKLTGLKHELADPNFYDRHRKEMVRGPEQEIMQYRKRRLSRIIDSFEEKRPLLVKTERVLEDDSLEPKESKTPGRKKSKERKGSIRKESHEKKVSLESRVVEKRKSSKEVEKAHFKKKSWEQEHKLERGTEATTPAETKARKISSRRGTEGLGEKEATTPAETKARKISLRKGTEGVGEKETAAKQKISASKSKGESEEIRKRKVSESHKTTVETIERKLSKGVEEVGEPRRHKISTKKEDVVEARKPKPAEGREVPKTEKPPEGKTEHETFTRRASSKQIKTKRSEESLPEEEGKESEVAEESVRAKKLLEKAPAVSEEIGEKEDQLTKEIPASAKKSLEKAPSLKESAEREDQRAKEKAAEVARPLEKSVSLLDESLEQDVGTVDVKEVPKEKLSALKVDGKVISDTLVDISPSGTDEMFEHRPPVLSGSFEASWTLEEFQDYVAVMIPSGEHYERERSEGHLEPWIIEETQNESYELEGSEELLKLRSIEEARKDKEGKEKKEMMVADLVKIGDKKQQDEMREKMEQAEQKRDFKAEPQLYAPDVIKDAKDICDAWKEMPLQEQQTSAKELEEKSVAEEISDISILGKLQSSGQVKSPGKLVRARFAEKEERVPKPDEKKKFLQDVLQIKIYPCPPKEMPSSVKKIEKEAKRGEAPIVQPYDSPLSVRSIQREQQPVTSLPSTSIPPPCKTSDKKIKAPEPDVFPLKESITITKEPFVPFEQLPSKAEILVREDKPLMTHEEPSLIYEEPSVTHEELIVTPRQSLTEELLMEMKESRQTEGTAFFDTEVPPLMPVEDREDFYKDVMTVQEQQLRRLPNIRVHLLRSQPCGLLLSEKMLLREELERKIRSRQKRLEAPLGSLLPRTSPEEDTDLRIENVPGKKLDEQQRGRDHLKPMKLVQEQIGHHREARTPGDLTSRAVHGVGIKPGESGMVCPIVSARSQEVGVPARYQLPGYLSKDVLESCHESVHKELRQVQKSDVSWHDGIPKVLSPSEIRERRVPPRFLRPELRAQVLAIAVSEKNIFEQDLALASLREQAHTMERIHTPLLKVKKGLCSPRSSKSPELEAERLDQAKPLTERIPFLEPESQRTGESQASQQSLLSELREKEKGVKLTVSKEIEELQLKLFGAKDSKMEKRPEQGTECPMVELPGEEKVVEMVQLSEKEKDLDKKKLFKQHEDLQMEKLPEGEGVGLLLPAQEKDVCMAKPGEEVTDTQKAKLPKRKQDLQTAMLTEREKGKQKRKIPTREKGREVVNPLQRFFAHLYKKPKARQPPSCRLVQSPRKKQSPPLSPKRPCPAPPSVAPFPGVFPIIQSKLYSKCPYYKRVQLDEFDEEPMLSSLRALRMTRSSGVVTSYPGVRSSFTKMLAHPDGFFRTEPSSKGANVAEQSHLVTTGGQYVEQGPESLILGSGEESRLQRRRRLLKLAFGLSGKGQKSKLSKKGIA